MKTSHRKCKRSKRSKESRRAIEWLVVLSTFTAALVGMNVKAIAQPQGLSFEIEDQFGVSYSSKALDSRPVIFVGGDRKASEGSRTWVSAVQGLVEEEPDLAGALEVMRVADLRGVPPSIKGMVSKRFRGSYSVPVLMDWDGQLAEWLQFQPRLTNIALIDASGEVLLKMQSNKPDLNQIETLKQALDELTSAPQKQGNVQGDPSLLGPHLIKGGY